MLVTFFLSPFIVHHLGNSAYGLWILVGSLTGYLGLLNLGVGSAILRYVARFYAEGNDQETSAVVSSALALFLTAGFISMLIAVVLAVFIGHIFHIPATYQFSVKAVVILAGSTVAVSMVSDVFSGTITALHRFDLYNCIVGGNRLLSAALIVFVLAKGKGLISLGLVNLSLAVLAGLAYAGVAFKLYPALKFRPARCDREHLKMILSFSIFAFLLQLSWNLMFYSDALVIGTLLPIGLITFFAIAGNLIVYSRAAIAGISALMTPRASALFATGSQEEVQELLVKATRFATAVILPIGLTFLLRGSSFIRLWMGQEYGERCGHVLWILALGLIFGASDQVATAVMLGIGRHKSVVIVVCGEALCNLALSIALVRPMGINGVAWGTTLPSLAVSFLFWPWYVNHTLGISVRKYVVSTWLRPAVGVIPFGLLTYGCKKLWPAPNLPIFALQIWLILPTVVLASWYSCFDPSDRKTYAHRYVQPVMRTFGWRG